MACNQHNHCTIQPVGKMWHRRAMHIADMITIWRNARRYTHTGMCHTACVLRYGLVIGARLSWFVRLLMFLTSPISWPMGKLLDCVLGTEHHVLFRCACSAN